MLNYYDGRDLLYMEIAKQYDVATPFMCKNALGDKPMSTPEYMLPVCEIYFWAKTKGERNYALYHRNDEGDIMLMRPSDDTVLKKMPEGTQYTDFVEALPMYADFLHMFLTAGALVHQSTNTKKKSLPIL